MAEMKTDQSLTRPEGLIALARAAINAYESRFGGSLGYSGPIDGEMKALAAALAREQEAQPAPIGYVHDNGNGNFHAVMPAWKPGAAQPAAQEPNLKLVVKAWGVFHADGSAHIFQQKEAADVFGASEPLYGAVQPAAQGPTSDQLTGAYWQGWCEAADWAQRDDLYADRGSQAYADAMNRRLGPIRAAQPAECVDEGCPHYGTPHGHSDMENWTAAQEPPSDDRYNFYGLGDPL